MGQYMHLFNSDSEHVAFASSSNYKEPYIGAINSAAAHVYYNVSEGITPHYIDEKPYDSEIEYLQSSGTQYIQFNLSVTKDQYFGVSGEMIALQPNTNKYYIFGANPAAQFAASFYSVSNNIITYGSTVGTNASSGGWTAKVNEKQYFELSTTGRTYQGVFSELNRPLTENITAFRIFASYTNNNRYPVKFCSFKITVGNSVVHDFIPVRKGTVGYMYDKISGTLYGNNGSGSFILGPDIDTNVLPYDNEVEYLYTDGNSYISLPINCDDNIDCVEMCFRRTAETVQHRFYGDSAGQIMVTYINGNKGMSYNTLTTSNASSWTALNNTYNKPGLVQHIIKTDYKNNKVYFDFDPYTMPTRNKKVATSNSFLITGPMGSNPGMVGNVYYVKYWRNNELLYDLVPVKKDGYGCFYDKIHNVIYRSSGSKDYTAGIDKYKKLSDYNILNYIENTTATATSPYIDCRIDNTITRPLKFEMTVKWNINTGRQIMGSNYSSFWGNEAGAYKVNNSTTLSETPSTSEFQTLSSGNITNNSTAPYGSMTLFRIYEPRAKEMTTTTFICRCKLGRYKIWANNVLVRDFIPVQHPSGRYGMFENVEKKFYDSANTGNFTGG